MHKHNGIIIPISALVPNMLNLPEQFNIAVPIGILLLIW